MLVTQVLLLSTPASVIMFIMRKHCVRKAMNLMMLNKHDYYMNYK